MTAEKIVKTTYPDAFLVIEGSVHKVHPRPAAFPKTLGRAKSPKGAWRSAMRAISHRQRSGLRAF